MESSIKQIWFQTYLESIKNEYDYTIKNSTKLDNKIYVSLLICMFLSFVFYSMFEYLKSIFTLSVPILLLKSSIFIYVLGITSLLSIFIVLLYLNRTIAMARIDVDEIFLKTSTIGEADVLSNLLKMYSIATNYNFKKLKKIS